MARILGQPLMPWQQYVADVALEVDDDDRLVYSDVHLSVMRRQGKTSLVRSLTVHRARVLAKRWGPQFIAYTAQDGKHARRKWEEDQVGPIDRSAYGPLGKARQPGRYGRVKFDNNDPGIFWANGSVHRPTAPTETAGHGDALDLGVIDEAFAHTDDRVEQAFGPAMLTRVCPQLWVMSAAGTDRSAYWWAKVLRGREMCEAGRFDGPTCYFEWSAADDEPYDDPEVWRRRMPALGHTVTKAAVAAELAKVRSGDTVDADDEGAGDQGLERFLRPYLGVWVRFPKTDRRPAVIPAQAWGQCRDLESQPSEPVAFAVEVPADRSMALVAVAGGDHVEVVDTRLGVDWVVPRLAELVAKWPSVGVGLRADGEAGALVPALVSAGVRVHEVSARNYARACGDLFDAVQAGRLRHIGQDVLDVAVAAGAKTAVGDGAWRWDRRASAGDITPLIAVTLARWVVSTVEPPAEPPVPSFVDLASLLAEED